MEPAMSDIPEDIQNILRELEQEHPWVPGACFKDDPGLAQRLANLIRVHHKTLARPRPMIKPRRACSVERCGIGTTHHHLPEDGRKPSICDGAVDDYDRAKTCCELGELLSPNPVPHGPEDPCTCNGCWACPGHVVGCTCDIDWDAMYEASRM